MKFTVNPNAEVREGFDAVAEGDYKLKILGYEEKTSQKGGQYLNWKLGFVDSPSSLKAFDPNKEGKVVANLGNIFYMTMLAADQQWNMRALVEGCGINWGSFSGDCDELINMEITARLKVVTIRNDTKEPIDPRNEIKKIYKAS